MSTKRVDRDLLEAALIGFSQRKADIEQKIAEIRSTMARLSAGTTVPAQGAPKKRRLSATARKRIAEAQRRRWGAVRKAQGAPDRP